jgi:hypothetical protein
MQLCLQYHAICYTSRKVYMETSHEMYAHPNNSGVFPHVSSII